MNSLFSSFDAYCAEILFGKNVKTSFTSSSSSSSAINNKAMDTSVIGNQYQTNRRSQPLNPQETKIGSSSPLLAPEFDGLNCFETFVFHWSLTMAIYIYMCVCTILWFFGLNCEKGVLDIWIKFNIVLFFYFNMCYFNLFIFLSFLFFFGACTI